MAANADDIGIRLAKKLEPQQIRLTLMHASLMQIVHEFIKQWVLIDVKAFYGYDDIFGEGKWLNEGSRERYEREVLALVPRKNFEASAVWLEQGGAITRSQRERLDEIYAYRHKLAHEGVASSLTWEGRQTPPCSRTLWRSPAISIDSGRGSKRTSAPMTRTGMSTLMMFTRVGL